LGIRAELYLKWISFLGIRAELYKKWISYLGYNSRVMSEVVVSFFVYNNRVVLLTMFIFDTCYF
jgi:hypothetical protein